MPDATPPTEWDRFYKDARRFIRLASEAIWLWLLLKQLSH